MLPTRDFLRSACTKRIDARRPEPDDATIGVPFDMVKICPQRLRGPWTSGFALDVHTTGSKCLGHNEYGHPVFETTRSPLGDLLYRLKYRGDTAVLPDIVEAVASFLMTTLKLRPDLIVPVPPSNKRRRLQPVLEIASSLSHRCNIPLCCSCIKKTRSTTQLKDVFELERRTEILRDAFTIDALRTTGRKILVFDDLYRSGATAGAICRLLSAQGGAKAVYLLTLTQTRKSL